MITLTTEQAQQIEEALESVHGLSGINMSNPLATIREARAQEQAEQDLDTCPGCGGVADNGHDREFPPNPYYCTKCIEQTELVPYEDMVKAVKEGVKQEPLMITPGGGEFPFAVVGDIEQAEQEPIRLQCTTCGTVYANGVPPQVQPAEQVEQGEKR